MTVVCIGVPIYKRGRTRLASGGDGQVGLRNWEWGNVKMFGSDSFCDPSTCNLG
jgi:hypothetical protein